MSNSDIDHHNSSVLAALARGDIPMQEESDVERYSLKLAQATKIIEQISSGKTLAPTERLKVIQYFQSDEMFCRVLMVEFLEDHDTAVTI